MGVLGRVILGVMPGARSLSTTSGLCGIRDRFISSKDLNKRPSDLEIQKKKLPKNTPTLGERMQRDKSSMFFVTDRKSGYYKGPTGTWRDFVDPEQSLASLAKESFSQLKEEFRKLKSEISDFPLEDMIKVGETRTIYEFREQAEREEWICTCDSTWGEGYSTAELTESPSKGKMLFSGEISTRIPQDGRIHHAGYANMKAVNRFYSFGRVKPLMLDNYNVLILKFRGDGRTYRVNLHIHAEFDLLYNDLWSFPLFTRGGPFWQTAVIPFSKFILTSKGIVQDDIIPVPQDEIVAIGITLMDNIDGPFSFEIDSIKGKYDPNPNDEVTAYEEYRFPRPNYNRP